MAGLAGDPGPEEVQRLETRSVERRKLIGQAIIDGLLDPEEATLLRALANYTKVAATTTKIPIIAAIICRQGAGIIPSRDRKLDIGHKTMDKRSLFLLRYLQNQKN